MSVRSEKFDSEGIRFEAAAWVLQLEEGNLKQEDHAALIEWCSRSPAHTKALRDYADAWYAIDDIVLEGINQSPADENTLHSNNENTLHSNKPLGGLVKTWVVPSFVACLLLLISVSWFDYLTPVQPDTPVAGVSSYVTYQTDLGKQADFVLEDGSVIHLNTDSKIQVSYTQKRRLIQMIRGEAHYEVAHDPNRPFDVLAKEKQISAIGTEFAVRLTNEGLNITVTEGIVGITTPENDTTSTESDPRKTYKALLSRNDKMVITDQVSTIERVDAGEIEKELYWRSGKLRFDSDTLADVINEVSRYTDQQIILEDQDLQGLRIGGVFRAGETEALLKAIELTFDLKIERIDKKTISISKSSPPKDQ